MGALSPTGSGLAGCHLCTKELPPHLRHPKGLFLIWLHTKLKIQGKTLTEIYFHNQIEKTFLRLVPKSYLILRASGFLFPFSK